MTNTSPAISAEVRQGFERIENEARKAAAFFHTWWALSNDSTFPQYRTTMSNTAYVDFFEVCRTGLHSLFFVALGKLLDPNRRALGLKKFRKILERHGDFADEADDIQSLLDSSASLTKKVLDIRNQAIAHNQESQTVEEVFKSHKVTPNEIRDLVHTITDTLNRVGERIQGPIGIPSGDRYENAAMAVLRQLAGENQ